MEKEALRLDRAATKAIKTKTKIQTNPKTSQKPNKATNQPNKPTTPHPNPGKILCLIF